MFGGGATGPGDLDAYYSEVSGNALQLVGTVLGDNGGTADCVNLASNRAFYNNNVANPDGDDDLVREALADIDATVDFADYDNNNDGTIDALGIIYAGGGRARRLRDRRRTPTTSGRTRAASAGAGSRRRSEDREPVHHQLGDHVRAGQRASACDRLQSDPDDRAVRARVRTLARDSRPVRHRHRHVAVGCRSWSAMANSVPEHDEQCGHATALRPVEQGVPRLDHADGARTERPLRREHLAVEDSGEVHQFLANPGGFQIGGTGEYFLVENRQNALFDANLVGCGSSSGTSPRTRRQTGSAATPPPCTGWWTSTKLMGSPTLMPTRERTTAIRSPARQTTDCSTEARTPTPTSTPERTRTSGCGCSRRAAPRR